MQDVKGRHMILIHFGIDNHGTTGRPPKTMITVHFLLCDIEQRGIGTMIEADVR